MYDKSDIPKVMVSSHLLRVSGHWWTSQKLALSICVVPDVRIPEREERRPPRQCNWQKGEVYY